MVSDWIEAIVTNIKAMGADVTSFYDGMIIHVGRPLHHAVIHTHKDHRIAMSFAVAALCSEGGAKLMEAECVNISYPEFYQHLRSLS